MNFCPTPITTRRRIQRDRGGDEITNDPGDDRAWSKEQTNTGRCRTSWMPWDFLARGVTCRDSREWVECAPRRRVARPGRRPSCPYPANGLYRRRARDWDPGFRMRGSLSRIKHAGAGTLAVSFPGAPTRLASLCLPYSAACRCSPAPAYSRGGWYERVTYPVHLPLPACPTCAPISMPLPLFLPLPCTDITEKTCILLIINPGDVVHKRHASALTAS